MKVLVTVILICSTHILSAQDIPMSVMDQVESFLEDQEIEADLIQVYDKLQALYQHPANINDLSHDDLYELRILSDTQINDLHAHIQNYGPFLRLEEMQSIASIAIDDIIRIRPFLKVDDTQKINLSFGDMFKNARNEIFLKWGQTTQDKKGFIEDENGNSNYIGDKNKLFLRYRSNWENRLKYGFILEKDEGEQLWSDTIYNGIDYFTGHIHLKDYSTLLQDVVIGDYTVSMGQGLISQNNFGAGKSAWATSIIKGGRSLRSYNSVNENGYFRGVATTLGIHDNIKLTTFYSNVNRDGNINFDTLNNETPDIFFSSIQNSGNHRSITEKEDKSKLGLSSIGGILTYETNHYEVSINHLRTSLSDSLLRSSQAYNLFRFNGIKLNNTSIDYNFRFQNFNIFGESAISSTGGMAHLTGLLIGLDRNLNLAICYRDYQRDYNALQPNAFGESSLVNNERGVYIGLDFSLNRNWKLRGYFDNWKHPWLRSRVSSPSSGSEYLLRLDYKIKRKLSLYVQYTFENKETNLSPTIDNSKLPFVGFQKREKLRFHFNNKVSKYLELRSRIEIVRVNSIEGESLGQLIFQDVIYKPIESPISFTARFALFDTDDSDSRIYAFENSILYEFSIPSYNGKGFRYYINLRYDLTRNLTGEFRIARTYRAEGEIGSGNELIEGPNRTDLKAQLRYVF